MDMTQAKRLAILAGVRTPQAKAFGALANVTAVELSVAANAAVLSRANLSAASIDEVIMGNVSGPADSANIARVISLKSSIPHDRIAHTVNRNCASGMEAIIGAWQAIAMGRAKMVLAGGTESMSQIPMLVPEKTKAKLLTAARAKTWTGRLSAYASLRLADLKPVMGVELGLTDPTCGLNMGQTAEVLADEFSISRLEQDTFAVESHRRAIAAVERGFLAKEITPISVVSPGKRSDARLVDNDVGPRAGQSLEQLAKLRPIFRKEGSVTAGNSCPLTDGATSLVLCGENYAADYTAEYAADLAQANSPVKPLGYISAYAIAGCDPRRMGLGPVFAVAKLLRQTGLKMTDFDLIEINEAFAVQVLACLKASASAQFAQAELGQSLAVGEINPGILNVNGGAIALGHPVGATGARLVLTLLHALQERGLQRGLATLCVGGGQGFAVVVERE